MRVLHIMRTNNDPPAPWSISEKRSRGAGEAGMRVDCVPSALVTIPNFCAKNNRLLETVEEEGSPRSFIEEEEDI